MVSLLLAMVVTENRWSADGQELLITVLYLQRKREREGEGEREESKRPGLQDIKKFWTRKTGTIERIYGPSQVVSQQTEINLFCSRVTLDLAGPEIGFKLIPDYGGNQNDPLNQEPLQYTDQDTQHRAHWQLVTFCNTQQNFKTLTRHKSAF